MKHIIETPEYNQEAGLIVAWEENFKISMQTDSSGSVVIRANSQGLISLAKLFLTLAQSSVPAGHHIHLDSTNSLEEGSLELIIERE